MATHTITLTDEQESAVAALVADLNTKRAEGLRLMGEDAPAVSDITAEQYIADRCANQFKQCILESKGIK